MNDTYQAVYDAVRSKLSHGDIGAAVESVMREANISHYVERAFYAVAEAAGEVAREHLRPFMLLKPRIFMDGDQWCALYGDNLQDGVAGFGDTPAQAAIQFDIEWLNAKAVKT